MISALHLIWIIPSATIFGFMFAALFQTAKREDEHLEELSKHKNSPLEESES